MSHLNAFGCRFTPHRIWMQDTVPGKYKHNRRSRLDNSLMALSSNKLPSPPFCSVQGSPYDAHTTGMTGAISYHPYGSPAYPYQLSDPAYRKNATRDATATLKAWLQEHRKNPYPTKGEKIMLAIITKMTLTQETVCAAHCVTSPNPTKFHFALLRKLLGPVSRQFGNRHCPGDGRARLSGPRGAFLRQENLHASAICAVLPSLNTCR
ncbi:uncharacterized protein LOC109366926 [Meleagris gallopavo]|uniref:uncharacterized protein LOC109366926 n=1 Tax=Meleagris gallopavo TaxID=9103 RepID=UPI00093D36C2|nr:uncharacterized protein LOC109366926 [Meleagris gallopavo]